MLYKQEVYNIIGAALEVYNVLGPGFLEQVYQEALEIEMTSRTIPYVSQAPISVFFKQHRLAKEYAADLICYQDIIVEIKAAAEITSSYQAQLLNYLKATHKPLGLLINFGHPKKLDWKRMIL